MIFYFSGTGNSLQAAKSIADYNGEKLVSIAKEINNKDGNFEYTLNDKETIGFVFPVYAWAPPKMVIKFIEKLKFNNYKDNYTFAVATCGENIGNTMKVLHSSLIKKGMKLSSGFSLRMPNNYIIMGNVDSKDVEEEKLLAAEESLKNINELVKERKAGVFQVVKGFAPGILTAVINPLFNKHAVNTKNFNVNDSCTGCGLCEEVCNSNTIKVKEKPQWGEECTQCLACIHTCPVKAINYGKSTQNKGRYRNPNVKVSEK
ncbi:4Fe-4S ferredoxin [Clostridium bovifaecis]|uniref:Ferredoxin n=1 Tax=Clostridium bovifaecis TaxID=2184719 RepID=A0A6I6ER08_9CLOT|nr:4Fe-4S ferredoxin [Clostridium bovifaecis]